MYAKFIDIDPPTKTVTIDHPETNSVSRYSVSLTQGLPEPPVTTVSETTQPPVQEEPTVAALPPFPSTPMQVGQLPPPSAVSATELPATGSSTWSTILLALAALGAGTMFLRLSRRPV